MLILERINTFYNTAWSQLVTFTFALLALVGGLIPLLISYYQNKQFKREQDALKKDINTEVVRVKGELIVDLEKKIEDNEKNWLEKLEELQKKYEKQFSIAEGRAFHVQAGSSVDEKRYRLACEDYVISAKSYIKGEDELNLQRALNAIINTCLPNVTAKELEDNSDLSDGLETLLSALKEADINGRYTDRIKAIRTAMNNARKKDDVPGKK